MAGQPVETILLLEGTMTPDTTRKEFEELFENVWRSHPHFRVAYDEKHNAKRLAYELFLEGKKKSEDTKRLDWLMNQTANEGNHGWCVTLDYNNYQDGARVLNADGEVIASCYDINKEPNDQFRSAIDAAIATNQPK